MAGLQNYVQNCLYLFYSCRIAKGHKGCTRSSGNGMTMEERLNSLLSETEDVAEKDKIYLNGLVRGGSEMVRANLKDIELLKKHAMDLNVPQKHIVMKILSCQDSISNGKNRIYLESNGVRSGLGKHILELRKATRGGVYFQEFIDNFENTFKGKRSFDKKLKEGFYRYTNPETGKNIHYVLMKRTEKSILKVFTVTEGKSRQKNYCWSENISWTNIQSGPQQPAI